MTKRKGGILFSVLFGGTTICLGAIALVAAQSGPPIPELRLAGGVGRPGGVACATGSLISGTASINTISQELGYAPGIFAVEACSIEPSLGGTKILSLSTVEDGRCHIGVNEGGGAASPIPSGVLWSCAIRIAPDAPIGDYPVSQSGACVDLNGEAMSTSSPAATIKVTQCSADCNGDNRVTVGELTSIVDHFLGRPICAAANGEGDCPGADLNGNGTISLGEVARAANTLFGGCPPDPTSTPSESPTVSPTSTATFTGTSTPSPSATVTASATPSITPSHSPTGTPSRSATVTATATPSTTPTLTRTTTLTRTPTITRTATPTPTPQCGNNAIDPGSDEICDGTDLGGETCVSLGLVEGSLTCLSDCRAHDTSACTISGEIPPPAAAVAPPLDRSVATSLFAATEFLYTGSDRCQFGVADGTIDPKRISLLSGTIRDSSNTALPGARISILENPELGFAITSADGTYHMVVNGGKAFTIVVQKPAYLEAQRRVETQWQESTVLPDVVLIQLDPVVNPIEFGAAEMQVARGSAIDDADGLRQATILVPPNTYASLRMPDGTESPASGLQIRLTEYTTGTLGLERMPAPLPPSTVYTYALELSADEAMAAGAESVIFSRALFFYVENFRNYPVGSLVPVGFYDRNRGYWVPSDNGLILKIVAVEGGVASIDLDGDDQPETEGELAEFGIDLTERQTLGVTYPAGRDLWRVPIQHFSSIDCNFRPEIPDYVNAPASPPSGGTSDSGNDCESPGSIIRCQSQILEEQFPVSGTPFDLHYFSDRVSGGRNANRLHIPVFQGGTNAPWEIRVTVDVAGQRQELRWSQDELSALGQTYPESIDFLWDGRDFAGRLLQAPQRAVVTVEYIWEVLITFSSGGAASSGGATKRYFGEYTIPQTTGGGGQGGSIDLSESREIKIRIPLSTRWIRYVGGWDARSIGHLGGWNLGVRHAYAPLSGHLLFGDGRSGATDLVTASTVTALPDGFSLQRVIAAPDGSLLMSSDKGSIGHVYRWREGHGLTLVAGKLNGGDALGEGIPAQQAYLSGVSGLAIEPDGSILVAETGGTLPGNTRLRRITPDERIFTVAGGPRGLSGTGDRGLATQARFSSMLDVAVGVDGGIFVTDGCRVRRISTDGFIDTVVGTGNCTSPPDDGFAPSSNFGPILALATAADGAQYFVSSNAIFRVGADGDFTRVAGRQGIALAATGDGGPAVEALLGQVEDIAVDSLGRLFIASSQSAHSVRVVDPYGTIQTIAGGFFNPSTGQAIAGLSITGIENGAPASAAILNTPKGVAVDADGTIFVADRLHQMVRKIAFPAIKAAANEFLVPDPRGDLLYVFDLSGRHLRTLHGLTRSLVYEFGYDAGLLASVTDAYGSMTAIERAVDGEPTAIVGPYGQRTELDVNTHGYLSGITDALGQHTGFEYQTEGAPAVENGLLTKMINRRGATSMFSYDSLGRLIRDDDPAGGYTELEREPLPLVGGERVVKTTALERATTFDTQTVVDGLLEDVVRTTTFPTGLQATSIQSGDGRTVTTAADGTSDTLALSPDPRFYMAAPAWSRTIATGGKTLNLSLLRSVQLDNPADPLSWRSITSTTGINGRTFTSTLDLPSRVNLLRTPAGRELTVSLNAQSDPTQFSLPGITPIAFARDARGRLTSIAQGTRTIGFEYDSLGYIAAITDPLGRRSSVARDDVGRVTSSTLPGERTVQFSRDEAGNMTSVTPPSRPAHLLEYDPLDQISRYQPPSDNGPVQPTQFHYDLDRKPDLIVRPDGDQIAINYDSAGRASSIEHPHDTLTYSYDAATGHLQQITTLAGDSISLEHAGKLLTSITWSGELDASLGFTWDDDLRLASEAVGTLTPVAFGYDSDGLLTNAGALTLERDSGNALLRRTVLGASTSTNSYNSFGEIIGRVFEQSGVAQFTETIERDAIGRVAQRTETVAGQSPRMFDYEYDVEGQLHRVTVNGQLAAEYTYDPNGNRVAYSADGVSTVTGTYDSQDRMLTYATRTYAYTANGDMVSSTDAGQTTVYAYDALGSLRSVTLPDGTVIDYVIDGANRRIGKRINGTLAKGFLYRGGSQIVAELDGAGLIVSQFVYAEHSHVPTYMTKDGTTYRIISDHLGSPRLVVDVATGQVAQAIDYDAFGSVTFDSNPGFQPFGFAGGLYEASTNLVRFGARDYDPQTGRWLAKDPILFAGEQSNLYTYVGNDPVNFVDPSGLVLFNLAGAALGAVSGGVGGYITGGWQGAVAGAVVGGFVGGVNPFASNVAGAAAGSAVASFLGQVGGNYGANKDLLAVNGYAIAGAAAGPVVFGLAAAGPGVAVAEGTAWQVVYAVGDGIAGGLAEGAGATLCDKP